MADNRKEQEREELHRTIWNIANDLRGSVDGWDFKQYVLGMLFYRYISENFSDYVNQGEREAGAADFDYADLPDTDAEQAREDLIATKGFFILPSQLFANLRKRAPQDENLNETLEAIFNAIEDSAKGSDSEENFKGLFDDIDVNSNKLGGTVAERNKRLVRLIDGVGDMALGSYQDNTIDAFGDAYEFLMGMYASNAGKSGGEYFTPQEVSELLTRIAVAGKTEVNKVYDPACGSGSLLLKAAKILGRENVRQGFYGQEINITTYNLCRINMFLHDIDYDKFDIAHGDTLTAPMHWDDEPFEVIWKILFDAEKIDRDYLYYYLQYDLALISKSTTKSTMVHVSMESMKKREIKLPPLDKQKQIASLIRNFDALCNDLTSGLPAEIEARQKQYEYYRDKLLSFKELGA